MHFDNLPPWITTLSGADPEPVVDPPADPATPDPDAELEAGRKALALVRTQGVKTAIGQVKGKDGKPKYQWADVDTVYALLDHDKVEIDLDSGAVSGLDEQLDALAKAKPFLLKVAEQVPSGPSAIGTPPGSSNSGHSEYRKTAASYAAEAPGVYGEVLGRLAGVSNN